MISATFSLVFSGFWARLGSCFSDFSGFSYFFGDFFGCFAVVWELFCGFQQFQLLFWRFFRLFRCGLGAVLVIIVVSATFLEIFPAVSLWLGSCFVDFSGFSYFFPEFFQLLGWICGEGIGTKQKREQSDYDDFFIASKEEAQKQFDNAESIVAAIIEYMRKNNSGTII